MKNRNVLVGIRIDSNSRDLLSWALVKVAEPGDSVIAIHVCRNADHASKDKSLLDSYLEVYEGLCSVNQVGLAGQIMAGSSVRRVLVREAMNYAAAALVVGMSKKSALGGRCSTAKYCLKKLPPTTDVLAINNGRIVFRRCNNNQLPESQSEFAYSEAETEKSSGRGSDAASKDRYPTLLCESRRTISRSSSVLSVDILEHRPGWPLQRRASSGTPEAINARKLSVVQWVMSLPNRSPLHSPTCSTTDEKRSEREMSDIVDESIRNGSLDELRKGLEVLLKMSTCGLKWFSYAVLQTATSEFSSENLIGKGGCNRVYKGVLPDGKHVAVKIMESSKEAWKDFAHEVDIISTLEHKNIAPLLGVCIEDDNLISVYHFLSKGSLGEYLHGKYRDKHPLSWEVRFNIAVGIAEALFYLHNECSRPVIHRDIKSSNILVSDKFEAQLSDFGLAIWGPAGSSFMTGGEVVGTFGDKVDVYAFGVVLLELLSGREPISSAPKGQESLVMWAKPKTENGDLKGLLDPNLDGKYDEVQMQRIVLAANLCTTRAARLRPTMKEILQLLRGDNDFDKSVISPNKGIEDLDKQEDNDDEVYPNSSAELHLSLALLNVDDDSTSFSSMEPTNRISMEEYLKGRWSRSSSFN
ncbi:protein kinase domain-containing protein [Citrus sinensis]|uniref:Protein kinase domain-containing protein n=1 Tax=Citrus sinensis TaxID=2711 RepID=A0ACB8ID16_CITSI|nr:protein kinase domain-containing protein [Citrus sinensis]